MSRDGILAKITKLLALAAEESGGTEAERLNAAERAQALMLKHRVEQHELEQIEGREALPGIESEPLGVLTVRDYWRIYLLSAIGRGIGVDTVYTTAAGRRLVSLVGRPDSIAYVKLMHDFLRPQIELACAVALAVAKRESLWGWDGASTRAFQKSFYEGAAVSVQERLNAARRDAEQTAGTDLVRSDRAALDAFYGDDRPERDNHTPYAGAGTRAGIAAGDKIDVNPANKVAVGDQHALPAGRP